MILSEWHFNSVQTGQKQLLPPILDLSKFLDISLRLMILESNF